MESESRLLKWGGGNRPISMDSRQFFSDWVETLIETLTYFLRDNWKEEHIPLSWNEALTVLIFSKGPRGDSSNHCGISLILIATEGLASIMLRRSALIHESTVSTPRRKGVPEMFMNLLRA